MAKGKSKMTDEVTTKAKRQRVPKALYLVYTADEGIINQILLTRSVQDALASVQEDLGTRKMHVMEE